jgi:hypothetical protein
MMRTVTFTANVDNPELGQTIVNLLQPKLLQLCPRYKPIVRLDRRWLVRRKEAKIKLAFHFNDEATNPYGVAHHWLTRACHATKVSMYDMEVEVT